MTESEWLAATDPVPMLAFLRDRATDRKLRLCFCAGCRTVWHLLVREESRRAVEVAERFADGAATSEELGLAEYDSEADCLPGWPDAATDYGAAWLANQAAHIQLLPVDPENGRPFGFPRFLTNRLATMRSLQGPIGWLFHDIFGNPFRPVAFAPDWRTDPAVSLARLMYDAREFSAMPILAEALQDAGCDDATVLDHCRSAGAHVRGCWVVDLVLDAGAGASGRQAE